MTVALDAWCTQVRRGVSDAIPRAGAFARHAVVVASTASTNDDVARAAREGAPEGYTVIAAAQTAGRGRRGTSFYSPPAAGIYLSTLLRPDRWESVQGDPSSPAAALVTLMAGVVVAGAVTDVCHAPVALKWPNDVITRQRPWRKLAGILAEGATEGRALRTIVVGIGLNLHRTTAAPDDVAHRMIALDELTGVPTTAEQVEGLVAGLLTRVHEGCGMLARGECAAVRAQWRSLAPSVDGTRVRWHDRGVAHTGRSAGIDERGALRIRADGGGDVIVHAGDLEWLASGDEA